jgi:4-amino-4-deoxy-L-arabinose transferase-like glycosyltransferase
VSGPGTAPAGWPGPGRRAVGLGILVGVVLRAIVLFTALGRPDSDEVIAGLMARHLFRDGFPAFFWGQHYGGTVELLPVALSLKVFGSSVPGLRVPTIALGALDAVLVWRCGRRMMAPGQAQVAGLLAWVWPAAAVWFGVREQLFYVPTLTLGLVAVLLALRLAPPASPPWWEWAALGLTLGVGWWTSPNVIYFLVPVAVVLFARRGQRWLLPPWAGLLVASAAALVGALPWLVTNVGSGFPSLHASDGFPPTGGYLGRVWWFFTHGLAAEMGFRSIGTLAWIGGALGVVAYLVAYLVAGVALLAGLRASLDRSHRWPSADAAGLVTFPWLLALVPFAMAQANLRYLFVLAPFLCWVLARLVGGWRSALTVGVAALTLTGVGLAQLHRVSETPGTVFKVGAVGSLDRAIAVLDEAHVTAVYADYWAAYRLVFESDERIVARPSAGTHRSAEYRATVEASPVAAWVVSSGSQADALTAALEGLGVGFHTVDAGEFVVVFTDRPVSPDELPNEARAPAGAEMSPPDGASY